MKSRICLIICLISMFALSGIVFADVVTDWNNVTLDAIRTNGSSPPVASRALAMVHAAIFDAVNTIEPLYQPYHVSASAPANTSEVAAAAEAAYTVLISIYTDPTDKANFDAALATSLASVTDPVAKANGIALGLYVGKAIVTWRSTDGSNVVVPYTPGTNLGEWRPTPPGFLPALLPNWANLTPFAMTSPSQFRLGPPPPLNLLDYAVSVNLTKSLGEINSTTRTADQTQIANFWSDGGGTATPPGHWNELAQTVAAMEGNTLVENAHLFALLNVAEADAAIMAWNDKYTYNGWRPITAIQETTKYNPWITSDPTWQPLLTTPNFPEYVSGHSSFSGAAAAVLAVFYGTDYISFTIGSDAMPGVYRTFRSFSEAADEAGMSRIYGGIHFEFSNVRALATGSELGAYVSFTIMQPRLPSWGGHCPCGPLPVEF